MTHVIRSVVFITITALTVPLAAVAELATTPGDNRIAIYEPTKWSWGDTHDVLENIAEAMGYTVAIAYKQQSAPSAPLDTDDLTIGEYTDALACGWAQQWGAGVLAIAGHGSSTGYAMMYYPLTDNGRVERYSDFVMLITTFSGLDTVTTDDGWAIEANASFHGTYYYPAPNNSGEVYLGGCQMLNWASGAFNGKSRCWAAYIHTVYISHVNTDADDYWQSRSGCCGTVFTTAEAASERVSSRVLQLGGNGASVLKPFVSRYRPPTLSVISRDLTAGSVTFNCGVGPNPFCISGNSSFSVDTQQFLNDSTYSFLIHKVGNTDGEVIVDGFGAVSANGRPLMQNFRIYLCTPEQCDENRAAGFEGAWVWPAGTVDSVVFATWPEVGSDSMQLVGYPPGTDTPMVLATVPAHGRPWVYVLTVPHGLCDRFAVAEIIDSQIGDTSSLFSLGDGPPEHLSALLAQNETLTWPPRTNKPVMERAGTEQVFQPAHLIAYSSRNDLLQVFGDVWQTLRSDGWVVNTWLGSKSAASCRWAFWMQWQANLNAGWPPPRCVVVGESNQDTLDSRNIVGMPTELDGTGDCFYETCANPGWWTDFYDRRRKEAPIYHVPVSTLAEAQNVACAWQRYTANYATAPRTLYLDVGDRDSCVAVPNPRQLLEQTIAPLYRDHGYTVTQHNESDFPCGYYSTARDSGRAVFNRKGGSEVVSMGRMTSLSQWAAKTVQKAYSYPWTNIPVPQQNRALLLSCDMGDTQREYANYPSLAKQWLTANPDSYAVMVAIVGYTRGGYGTHQDTIASNLFRIRWSGSAVEMGEVVWQTEQELWDAHPELTEDFYRLYVLGLPVPLPDGPGLTAVGGGRVERGLFALERCFPNPFSGKATLRFSVAQPVHIALRVFDASGRLVTTLADRRELPGYYAAHWDGRDGAGRHVPSGVYFVSLSAGKMALTERIVLLR